MNLLEEITEKVHDAYFVDLFVRVSNQVRAGDGAGDARRTWRPRWQGVWEGTRRGSQAALARRAPAHESDAALSRVRRPARAEPVALTLPPGAPWPRRWP